MGKVAIIYCVSNQRTIGIPNSRRLLSLHCPPFKLIRYSIFEWSFMGSLSLPVVLCVSAFIKFTFTRYLFTCFDNASCTECFISEGQLKFSFTLSIMTIYEEIFWFSFHCAGCNVSSSNFYSFPSAEIK